jgi:branched-chain amino acid transport system permease protein
VAPSKPFLLNLVKEAIMDLILQATVNGILMGSIYGLTALGLTLIFGVIKVINFAHGSLLMVGMYTAYWLVRLTGINPYLALIIVVPLLFFFGYYMQEIVIKPVFKAERDVREPITVIIVTTGVWYVLDNLSLMLFGAEYRVVKTGLSGKTFLLGELIVSTPKFYGFVATIVTAVLLYWFLKKTRMGKAIMATSFDRDAASLMGINQYRIYNIAFGIGTAIAGVAGCVLIPFYYVFPTVGVIFDIRCFIIVVLGGLGSIHGAVLGGIIIGVIESVFAQFMASTWTEGIIYAIFILILFIKPSGLFGARQDW